MEITTWFIDSYVMFYIGIIIVIVGTIGMIIQGKFKKETTIDYKDIKGFPISTVPGHKGRFVFGYVDSVPVVIMQGCSLSYRCLFP